MKKTIGILGAGWLGTALAKELIHKDFRVKVTTTTKNKLQGLRNLQLEPYYVALFEEKVDGDINDFLEGCTTLVINIPPGLRQNPSADFVKKIAQLLNYLQSDLLEHIVYISSTAVFEETVNLPIITSDAKPDATTANGKQLISVEKMLADHFGTKCTILRFGGLLDKDRHPGKFLSGRSDISNPQAPINLIHRYDCIRIIIRILELKYQGLPLNACYPYHPTKQNYYTKYCLDQQLEVPAFSVENVSKGKIIAADKIKTLLNYEFKKRP